LPQTDLQLEIAHLLLIDIVGYSKLLVNEQIESVQELGRIVRSTECFRNAEENGKLIRVPTGDGMALLFFRSPEEPVRCALEISHQLKENSNIRLRMGIHSGPVNQVRDVNDTLNVAGTGINVAQRVMDCGDAGHILLSKHVADDLAQYRHWRPYLQDLGECEVKHGLRLGIVNLYKDGLGNPNLPEKLKRRKRWKQSTDVIVRPVQAGRWPAFVTTAFILSAIVAAITLAIYFGYGRLTRSGNAVTIFPEKSIAVLPFENRSAEKANAYFADGIQDEILTRLAKISDLKVISRTSTQHYKNTPENLREIAKQLGVAHIVEGSVQRSGDAVRVNVQLIEAANDTHLWADTFDRKLTDIFSVESDIAKAIADQLQAKLTGQEAQAIAARPTASADAYLAYLEAQDVLGRAQSPVALEEAIRLYKRAIEIDPSFALAFARLSYAEGTLYQVTNDSLLLAQARAAANEALRLEPRLAEGHLALGYLYYRGDRDYQRALIELESAKAGLPNESEIFLIIGSIERREGKWSESTEHLEKATALNPNDVTLWMNLAVNQQALRRVAAAATAFDKGAKVAPSFFINRYLRARLDIDSNGDMKAMERLLREVSAAPDPDGRIALARFELQLLQRQYNNALQTIRNTTVEKFAGFRPGGVSFPKSFLLGQAYRFLNDRANARTYFEKAKYLMEKEVSDHPLDAPRHAILGEVYASLGQKNDAIHQGKLAVQLLPESKDALDGPLLSLTLARIYAIVGDSEAAIALLSNSRSCPRGITSFGLRLDPEWDPLRSNARFQELVANETPP